MTAYIHDIKIEQGAMFKMHLRWLDDAGDPNPLLVDRVPRMQVRPGYTSETLWLNLTADHITIDTDAGTVSVVAGATMTALLPRHGQGVYDLELESTTDPDDVIRLVEGRAFLRPEVTR